MLSPDRADEFPKFTLRAVLDKPVRSRDPDVLTSVRVGEISLKSIKRIAWEGSGLTTRENIDSENKKVSFLKFAFLDTKNIAIT